MGEALRREIMSNVAYPPFPDPLSYDVFSGNVPRMTVRTEGQAHAGAASWAASHAGAASSAASSCACVHQEGRGEKGDQLTREERRETD